MDFMLKKAIYKPTVELKKHTSLDSLYTTDEQR